MVNPALQSDPPIDLIIHRLDLDESLIQPLAQAFGATGGRVRQAKSIRLRQGRDNSAVRQAAAAFAGRHGCDVVLVPSGLQWRQFRVLAMDMDSTLIAVEGIDEVAAMAGHGAAVAAITEAAMRGEITEYSASLRQRVRLLAGAAAGILDAVWDQRIRLSPGARVLIAAARGAGIHTLVVSGGFTCFAERLQAQLAIDEICANDLAIADGRLTGEVRGPAAQGGRIVDAEGKLAALQAACGRAGCDPARAIAIGDGANDLRMLGAAGLPVAYHAKPAVRAQVALGIEHGGLDSLLEWFTDAP